MSSNNIETSILPYLIRDLFSTKAIIIILASYVTQDILAKWMVVGWYRLPSLVTSTYVGIKQQKNAIFHQKISSGRLTLWKPWPKYFDLPSGNFTVCDIENDHRNSGFSHEKWWFSIAMLNYQRVFLNNTVQWEFQDPKMKVLYHIRPYFVGISPYIGLI